MYSRYIKRILDFTLALIAIIALLPLMLILVILGTIAMRGNPFFVQARPGRNERIFMLLKLRTMTNQRDSSGNLLSDALRLNPYGRLLRSTSLDELPELVNIIKGDMAIVGPRPQLVRDMVFMTPEQRKRHSIRPGLTGLAQVNGRNSISWEQKLEYDLEYLSNICFWGDMKIILETGTKVFTRKDIHAEGIDTAEDFGDYLLRTGKIDQRGYEEAQVIAKELLRT